jgi:hypothetical protein
MCDKYADIGNIIWFLLEKYKLRLYKVVVHPIVYQVSF